MSPHIHIKSDANVRMLGTVMLTLWG